MEKKEKKETRESLYKKIFNISSHRTQYYYKLLKDEQFYEKEKAKMDERMEKIINDAKYQ